MDANAGYGGTVPIIVQIDVPNPSDRLDGYMTGV